MEQDKTKNIKTADIVAETLLDWGVYTIFGIPGDGINGFIEALRMRQDRIRFMLVKHEESAIHYTFYFGFAFLFLKNLCR